MLNVYAHYNPNRRELSLQFANTVHTDGEAQLLRKLVENADDAAGILFDIWNTKQIDVPTDDLAQRLNKLALKLGWKEKARAEVTTVQRSGEAPGACF